MLLYSCGVSILHAFIYRLATMRNHSDWYEKRSVLVGMVLLQVGYGLPCAATYLTTRLDEAFIVENIKQARTTLCNLDGK